MGSIGITLVVVLVVVFGVAAWMDFKRRRLHDTKRSGVMGQDRRRVNLESKEKGSRWSAGA
jgi:uncharacterized membrane protein YhaH (DUF805 family)